MLQVPPPDTVAEPQDSDETGPGLVGALKGMLRFGAAAPEEEFPEDEAKFYYDEKQGKWVMIPISFVINFPLFQGFLYEELGPVASESVLAGL